MDQRWSKEAIKGPMDEKQDIELGLHDRTGALLMLNKKERKLLKELLIVTLRSERGRDYVAKKLGSEYVAVGEKLLTTMGVN